jgi:hypothetical protein
MGSDRHSRWATVYRGLFDGGPIPPAAAVDPVLAGDSREIPCRRTIALNQYRFADPAFKGSKEIEPNVVPEPRIGRKVRELVYNRSKVQPHLARQA